MFGHATEAPLYLTANQCSVAQTECCANGGKGVEEGYMSVRLQLFEDTYRQRHSARPCDVSTTAPMTSNVRCNHVGNDDSANTDHTESQYGHN
jgi:hypothetical protein